MWGVDSARRGERSPNEFSREAGMGGGGGGGFPDEWEHGSPYGMNKKKTSMKRIEML